MLIWESSYGSISVDDICKRAGVNKGSFYYAFKSKSDLAAAAFEDHWNKKRGLMDEIFSSQVPPLATAKLLLALMAVIARGPEPVFESVAVMAALAVLTTWLPKLRPEGERPAVGALIKT